MLATFSFWWPLLPGIDLDFLSMTFVFTQYLP